jgi:acyl-coenzyme A synthetase/AMP-(fatty) acid ligase
MSAVEAGCGPVDTPDIVGSYMRPRIVEVTADVPETVSGKIPGRELRG